MKNLLTYLIILIVAAATGCGGEKTEPVKEDLHVLDKDNLINIDNESIPPFEEEYYLVNSLGYEGFNIRFRLYSDSNLVHFDYKDKITPHLERNFKLVSHEKDFSISVYKEIEGIMSIDSSLVVHPDRPRTIIKTANGKDIFEIVITNLTSSDKMSVKFINCTSIGSLNIPFRKGNYVVDIDAEFNEQWMQSEDTYDAYTPYVLAFKDIDWIKN